MRVGVLFTGGKDSSFALHKAIFSGQDVKALCSIEPRIAHPMLYHAPYIGLVKLHSKAYGIPVHIVKCGEDEYRALENLLDQCIEKYSIEGIVTGALLSDYQRIRFTMMAYEKKLWVYNPIWRKKQEDYMRMLVELGFKFIITRITAMGIPHDLLGKPLDRDDVDRIIRLSRKWGFNPAFEGGEAETLVLDAPLMNKRLVVKGKILEKTGYEAEYVITEARLEEKEGKNPYKA